VCVVWCTGRHTVRGEKVKVYYRKLSACPSRHSDSCYETSSKAIQKQNDGFWET
jgi:uncharacterized Fe-S cluster protein YjdI